MKVMPSWMLRTLMASLIFGLTAVGSYAAAEPGAGDVSGHISPLQGPFQNMTSDELFAKLLESNRARDARLQKYSVLRTYEVTSDKGKVYAQEVVSMHYQAPDQKSFRTESEEGSRLVRDLVLKRLIESESETTSGQAHRDSSMTPANYELNLLGEQNVGPYRCIVAEVTPKRKDKYLFEGRVWINTEDYAVVKIAGQPAKSLSFWITRADFVRQYEKIGEFWFPAQDKTLVHMRLAGNKILSIQHRNYVVNQDTIADDRDVTSENRANPTR
jgi:outer membrane lipoprotein-sorting protein